MDGIGFGALALGSVFAYAGIKGYSIPDAVQAIVQGKSPATLQQAAGVTLPTDRDSSGVSNGDGAISAVTGVVGAQATLQQTAARFGWTDTQWQALQQVEAHEAGFNPQAKNPSSGALGLAQALGHGNARTRGTLGNEYGGYGLSDAQAKAANSGDAAAQALWMCNYIKSRYGDPVKAWAFWQAHHYY